MMSSTNLHVHPTRRILVASASQLCSSRRPGAVNKAIKAIAQSEQQQMHRRVALSLLAVSGLTAIQQRSALAQGRADDCAVVTAANGLGWCDIVEGSGDAPQAGQMIRAHYAGTLTNGAKFDSSYDRGRPLSFKVGVRQVIQVTNYSMCMCFLTSTRYSAWDIKITGMQCTGPMFHAQLSQYPLAHDVMKKGVGHWHTGQRRRHPTDEGWRQARTCHPPRPRLR
jgi:hypothetical protein